MNHLMLSSNSSILKNGPLFYRIIAALFAGHIITSGGEFQNLFELAKLGGYPIAMISSVIIAFLAIEQVRYLTLFLNTKYPIYDNSYVKIRWQILLCLIVPFATIFFLAALYYSYLGYWILDTLWLGAYGWLIFLMLVALNMLFCIRMREPITESSNIELKQLSLELDPVIQYIVHERKFNRIHYARNNHLDDRSLEDIFKTLDPHLYILNPRSSIIKRDNIKNAYKDIGGKLRIELFFPEGMFAIVSSRQKIAFKGYF